MIAKTPKQFVQREKPIPEYKQKSVKDISDLIKSNKTLMVVSVSGLPGKQYGEIKKKLKGKAKIKLTRKRIMFRAIDKTGNKELEKIKEHIKESSALMFSDLDCFELSATLNDYKIPAKAKIGQEAPEDIIIEPGETDLTPGPVISEFGNLGVKIAIEDGKINIKEKKVIVKEGEKVSEIAASIMGKLEIMPFSIGLIPVVAFDSEDNKLYTSIKVNKEEKISELKELFAKTKAFAISVGYVCKETIGFLLAKAESHAKALQNLSPKEEVKEQAENSSDEKKDDAQVNPENKTE